MTAMSGDTPAGSPQKGKKGQEPKASKDAPVKVKGAAKATGSLKKANKTKGPPLATPEVMICNAAVNQPLRAKLSLSLMA